MRLALGRKGAYSIEAVMYLARRPGSERCKAREIGEAIHAPVHYLPQILADLVHGHILVAEAGRDGGYRLARPPEEITLFEVVEAAEGPVIDDRCQLTGEPFDASAVCPFHEPWVRVCGLLVRELQRTTLADLSRMPDGARYENDRRAVHSQFL